MARFQEIGKILGNLRSFRFHGKGLKMPKKPKALALPEIEDAIISKDYFCKVCKLSKRHAEYLLQSGLVPCVRTGRKTRSYRIRREDILHYLIQREQSPEKYRPPKTGTPRS